MRSLTRGQTISLAKGLARSLAVLMTIALVILPLSGLTYATEYSEHANLNDATSSVDGENTYPSDDFPEVSDPGNSLPGDPTLGDQTPDAPLADADEPQSPEATSTPPMDLLGSSNIDIAPASTAADLVAQINAIAGLQAIESTPNVVTVTNVGGPVGINTTLGLNIDAGVTIQWNATLFGSLSSSTASLINVSGSGTFITSSCSVINTGTGGALTVSGAGTTVTVDMGSTVASDGSSGNGILVTANNVMVNVYAGGVVESYESDQNAAIQVNNGLQGVLINVDGGTVISDERGYAINDGAGSTTANNSTNIVINSGTVSAGTACAIHSTGTDSTVTIYGGTVTSYGTSVANPTIYMNGTSNDSVFINGGRVQNTGTSNTSYSIMTTGNVLIADGEVLTNAGRAINLVGMNSTATVSGGIVQATGTGVAISTATTDVGTVANASVIVSGGTVSSSSGNAINVTGVSARVEVSGGSISATSGNAINASGANAAVSVEDGAVSATSGYGIYANGATAAVTASGGVISATTGTAIRTTGAGSTISVSDERVDGQPPGGPGAQVSVLKAGAAITSGGAITVDGGFVFAYGSNASTAISTTGSGTITWPTNAGPNAGGIVAVWNQASGKTAYAQLSYEDLTSTFGTGLGAGLQWVLSSTTGVGIMYSPGDTMGFFPFDQVVIAEDYGLIFDSSTGLMYMNIDGSGTLTPTNSIYTTGRGASWDGAPGLLTLNGFFWMTNNPIALTIINGDTTISLSDTSTIGSAGPQLVNSFGIFAPGLDLRITGSGSLEARGGTETGSGQSYGIGCDDIRYEHGTFIARGDTDAFAINTFISSAQAYSYWMNTVNSDPTGLGRVFCNGGVTPYDEPYTYTPNQYKFVKVSSATAALVSNTTVTGTMKTALSPQSATITLYDETLASNLVNVNASGWFNNLPTGITVTANATSGGDVITLTFSGTPLEGSSAVFDILIPGGVLTGGTDISVEYNPDALFDIEAVYELYVSADTGGTVSGTISGDYLAGTPISVLATAASDYQFAGWTMQGVTISSNDNPAVFLMPANRVILTANFEPTRYTLTVLNGLGGGSYPAGATVNITAATAPAGKVFDRWESSGGGTFANASAASTTFIMPANPVTIAAFYRDDPSSQSTGAGSNSNTPQTGDRSGAAGMTIALIACVAGALCVFAVGKSKRKDFKNLR